MSPKPEHGMGWRPDLPDYRDYRFASLAAPRLLPPALAALPEKVDLTRWCSPVEDQGYLGSCTAESLVGALELLRKKDALPALNLSPLFLYYNERAMEGSIGYDSGAYIRDGVKSLSREGICTSRLWPYWKWRYKFRPSARAYLDAGDRQILSYWRIETLDEMRTCLADGYPFVFGFTVYDSFLSAIVARTGNVSLPQPGEGVAGGHAVLCVGYDDTMRTFLCRNSWGTGWGRNGYFSMPYKYLEDRDLSDDFWTIRGGEQL